jgi:hypothetical protein
LSLSPILGWAQFAANQKHPVLTREENKQFVISLYKAIATRDRNQLAPFFAHDAKWNQPESNDKSRGKQNTVSLLAQQCVDITIAHDLIRKGKRTVFTHLARGAQESAERGARERAADADAFDSDCGELAQAHLNALQAHHDIDGAV